MSVIIRLQNLPWSANALDIRQYFAGLSIPEGGVHIVGGEQGDAFIAFSTDEDARQAFLRNNGKIKEIQISLSLSSRTEMQRVIEVARQQSFNAFMRPQQAVPLPAAIPPISSVVPENKSDSSSYKEKEKEKGRSEKRDKKRSRSRERTRSRYRRSRSRTRSRERRRSRRDRSRNRVRSRSRSKEHDRKPRERKRSSEKSYPFIKKEIKQEKTDMWSPSDNHSLSPPSIPSNFMNFQAVSEKVMATTMSENGYQPTMPNIMPRSSWPPPSRPMLEESNLYGGDPRKVAQNLMMLQQNYMPNKGFSSNPPYNLPSPALNQNYSSCVKIEPVYCAYAEIRRFFSGLFISNTGIKLINDNFGHRTGSAYIRFGNAESKRKALDRNHYTLNGVSISVTEIDDIEFEKATDNYKPEGYERNDDQRLAQGDPRKMRDFYHSKDSREIRDPRMLNPSKGKLVTRFSVKNEFELKLVDFHCLTVEDLPTVVKEQDILKLFTLYPLTSLILTTKGRNEHVAYVRFSNSEDARKALGETPLHIIDGKQITVKPCSDEEFNKISKVNDMNLNSKVSKEPDVDAEETDSESGDCISISGLPLRTNERDISDFFSDIALVPSRIYLATKSDSMDGQAFCEFSNEDDIAQALKKDATVLGSHLVTVKVVSKEEMNKVLAGKMDSLPNLFDNPIQPPKFTPRPNFMHPNQRGPFTPRFDNFPGRGGRGGFHPRGMGPRPPRFFNPKYAQQQQQHPLPEDGPPGCTVYMDNIPYKAGTKDILQFFSGFKIINNISRKFNSNNTPSAEARVVFNSPEEAERACREKSVETIWGRTIYLKQV